MATATAKQKNVPSPGKRTVAPLFLDQHGTEDEDGNIIECFAEDMGSIRLYTVPVDPKKNRTQVSKEDFWKEGWELGDDGKVDPETIELFVIDPYTTTQQDIEDQFGEGRWYVDVNWGPNVPDKFGIMKGAHGFATGGGVKKKRGMPVVKTSTPPAAKPKAAEEEQDEPETPEETIERLETEAAERDERLEALEKRLNERVTAPAPSPMAQMKETVEVMNAFGHGPQAAGAAITQQREQWWQEQLANERQQSANTLQQVTRAAAADLSTLRSELTGITTAASIRYEGLLKDLRDDNRTAVNTLNEQLAARDKAHIQALSEERNARVEEIKRRDAASDQATSTLKTLLGAAEIRLSDLRYKKDDEVSKLTGDGNVRLLESSMATMHLNIEREKATAFAARIEKTEAELTRIRGLWEEQRETIFTMKHELVPRKDGPLAEAVADAGFRIHPIVMSMIAPIGAVIVTLVVGYFLKRSEEMPQEVKDFVENFRKATQGQGKVDPIDWAEQQARARQARAEEEAEVSARAQEEAETRQRSANYEEEQRQAAREAAREAARDAADRASRETEARIADERRRDSEARAARESAAASPAAVKPADDWQPPYGGNTEAVAASGVGPTVATAEPSASVSESNGN